MCRVLSQTTTYAYHHAADGAVIEIEAENRHIYGMVHITKVDKDYPDNLLAGAIFEIYMDVDGNKEFSADGLKIYKRNYDGTKTEVTDWKFSGTPDAIYKAVQTK